MSGCQKTLFETPSVSEPILTVSDQKRILKDSFFAHTELLSLPIQKVVQNLKDQDSASNFITTAWVAKNGLPVWDKILSSTSNKPTVIGSRSSSEVNDISFIPLKDTLSGTIKSYIAVYHLENDAFGYRLYNRDSVTLFIPANATEKPEVVRILAIYAYFEQTINNRAETFIPQPYNITFRNIQIGIGNRGNVITARTQCQEVCIEGEGIIGPIAGPEGIICWNICTYDGPLQTDLTTGGGTMNSGGSSWANSSTGGGNGSSSSSLTYLDGLISNSTFLSDLSSALDPDGLPESEFRRKFPDYADLIAPLRQLKQFMGYPDVTDLALYVRNPALITQLNAFLSSGGNVADAALHKDLLKEDIDYFNANKNAGFPQIGSEAWEEAIKDPIFIARYLYVQYISECAILKKIYPYVSNSDIRWTAFKNVMSDATHIGLDMCGLFPLLGEPCDIANGIFYSIQGEGVNAALSFGSAVPILGWASTGAKYALKVIGISGRTYKLSYEVVNGIIKFGDKDALRSQLRRILNLNAGDGFVAHHIIPLDVVDQPLAQAAAKYKAAFHPNEINNGIALTASIHTGSHQAYSDLVEARMSQIYQANGGVNITPQKAHEEIQNLMKSIRLAIQNNPNMHINNITF